MTKTETSFTKVKTIMMKIKFNVGQIRSASCTDICRFALTRMKMKKKGTVSNGISLPKGSTDRIKQGPGDISRSKVLLRIIESYYIEKKDVT